MSKWTQGIGACDGGETSVVIDDGVEWLGVAYFERAEDAERAVACRNALEGVEDPEAFIKAVRDLVSNARTMLDTVKGPPVGHFRKSGKFSVDRAMLAAAIADVEDNF